MPSVATIVIQARDNASDDIARVARSLAKLNAATGRPIRLDGSGIGGVAQGMRGAEQAAAKLTQTTGGLGGSLRTVAGAASGLAGVFGVAFGAQAMVGFAAGAVTTANSLEVTQARVQALAGSTERYNEILRLARSGQQAYGGTLEENVAALGGFVNMSNRTGVAIDTLDNAARRLAAADPVQGIEGASVALREFLTGTGAEAVVSLAERFELPKAALAALAAEGVTTQQRMAGLNTLLNDMGYTNEFLAASADTTAASYGRLSSAWSNFTAIVGSGISTALEPAAVAVTNLLTRLSELGSIENLVKTATGERAAVLQASLPTLLAAAEGTQAEEDAVRSLIGAYFAGTGAYAEITAGTALFKSELAALTVVSQATTDAEYANQLAAHGLTTAHQEAAYAAVTERDALEEETAQSLINENQTKLTALAKDELSAKAALAAQNMLASGDASVAAAQHYADLYGISVTLIQSQYQLAAAANTAAAALANAAAQRSAYEDYRAGERNLGMTGGGIGSAAKERQAHALAAQQLEERKAAAEAAAKAAAAAAKTGASAAKKGAASAASAAKKEASAEASAAKKAASAEAKAQADAAREAEQLQKAQDALLSDEERLAVFRQRLAAGGLPEVERLELMKQIADLEETVTNEQEKQRRAALDAALAAIDDRKQRREEAKEIAAAQRVLASGTTSEAQKAAARDVLERIPLEQEKRAQAIADKLQDAGQAAVAGGAAGAPAVPVSVQPVATAPISIAQAGLPQAGTALPSLTINQTLVLPDGTVIGSGSATMNLNNPVADLRLALRAAGV